MVDRNIYSIHEDIITEIIGSVRRKGGRMDQWWCEEDFNWNALVLCLSLFSTSLGLYITIHYQKGIYIYRKVKKILSGK